MASWTTPRTANVGDVYTAAWYNTDTRDNLDALTALGVCGQPFAASQTSPGTNGAKYAKIWAKAGAITSIEIVIQASAGNIDVGLYSDSSDAPGSRLWSRGSVASPGTGQQSFPISAGSPASLTLTSGPLWVAIAGSSSSLQVGSCQAPKGVARQAGSAFPLAATAPTLTDTNDYLSAILR